VKVRNRGDQKGRHTVRLRIDGETVATEKLTLSGGEAETLRFSPRLNSMGKHSVSVNNEDVGTVTANLPYDYTVIEIRDVSYANVVRLAIGITPQQSLAEFSQQELIWIAQDVVNRVTSGTEVNAIGISFVEKYYHYGNYPHCVGVDWAPYGDWSRADESETGQYDKHEYSLQDHRDSDGYTWCDDPED
jgi:hypothetical protein